MPGLANLPRELLLPEEKPLVLLGLSLAVSVSHQLSDALPTLAHPADAICFVLAVAMSIAAVAKPLLHPLALFHQLCTLDLLLLMRSM